ncbi:MAG: hypothetical protein OXJ90_14875 [Spirochaetaceae bacterium]|nr:hypothetical protein [Spirochaetaceae bacterium]
MEALVPIVLSVVPTAVFAGLFAALVSDVLRRSASTLEKKREILFRVASNRHLLTPGVASADRFPLMSALNEACMVFARNKQVVSELKRMLALGDSTDGLVYLMKAMAKSARVPVPFDDEFLKTPFASAAGATSSKVRQ